MTDYIPFTTDEYAPDAPATALHFERWFRNWIAAFEGASGAPRIAIGALERLNPGEQVRSRQDAEVTGPNAGTVAKEMFSFIQAGTVRVAFDHRNTGSAGGTVSVIRVRNGVSTTVASFSNTTTYQTRSVDVSVLPGDSVRISNYAGSLTTQNAQLRNCRVQTNGEDLYPGVSAYLEGNTYA